MLSFVRAEGAVTEQVLEGWYRAHFTGLARLATLACGDPVAGEDAVQEVFAQMLCAPPVLREPDHPLPYLRVSVLNRCRSGLRRQLAGEQAGRRLAGQATSLGDDVERDGMASATRRDVLEAVRALPARQRDVVLLRHYLELSEAEIAKTLGISAGTVKSSASRARHALAQVLEAQR